jgi:hypothetical protein
MVMRKLLIATALAGAAALVATPALAAEGCGAGAHRNHNGRCKVNRGYARPGVAVAAPGVVLRVGGFYPGRGYWDGRRYYKTRYRYRGGWRYR